MQHVIAPSLLSKLRCCAAVLVLLVPATLTHAQLMPLLGGQRAGISSLQFLKLGAGARAAAMGESFVAVSNDVSALHYNPAGIVQFSDNQVHFSHSTWLVDLNHEFAGAVYHLSPADALGVFVTSLNTEDMEITTETQPLGTGRYFHYGDVAIGLSYARALTSQFSFGATVKYVEETIDVLKTRAVLVDLGTYYWTGLGSTRFSVAVSNFGQNVAPEGDVVTPDGRSFSGFQDFSPPTVFRIGFAMDPIQEGDHRLTTAIQLNHPNDNSENLALGAEYGWNELLFARAGYKLNVDEESLSAGAGVRAPLSFFRIAADYAFVAFGRLGSVHKISLTIGF